VWSHQLPASYLGLSPVLALSQLEVLSLSHWLWLWRRFTQIFRLREVLEVAKGAFLLHFGCLVGLEPDA